MNAKKLSRFLIPAVIILFIIGFAAYRYYRNRTIFNDGYVNGNSPGNLYNYGLFCEHDGTIYFSNPNDNHFLYSMNANGGNVTKLYEDVVSFINADDNYIYYVRNNASTDSTVATLSLNTNSLCRYSLKTKRVKVLDKDPSIYASLIGNYLYYIHYSTKTASTLYRVKIDGSEKEQVDKNPYFTCSANGQYFYYNGVAKDHNIYQMDTANGGSHIISEGNFWMPSADNEAIYFLDCEDNYSLVKMGRFDEAPKTIVSDRIESYNVCGDTIYFQRNNLNDDAALCSVKTDGSDYRVILEGSYSNINATSRYVYFSRTGQDNMMFQMPLNGNGSVSTFNP